jgi:Uncharacterized conserved protein
MKGSCLCGSVTYEITPPFKTFQYCHCSRCRKFTGSAYSPNIFVPPDQFLWTKGEDQLGRFEHPEAKYFATCFCKNCGSSLPWAVQGGVNIVVPVGTLDENPGIAPQRNVFWGSRPDWLVSDCELEKFDELPSK